MHRALSILALVAVLAGCASTSTPPRADNAALQAQVFATERAFAQTMAARDHAAFASYLADDTVFFASNRVLRGKAAVAAAWKAFYEKPEAPFSWAPERVEVLDDGMLALSTGPVQDPSGKLVAQFTSIWRQESPGVWRIIFDRGNDVCDCAKP